MLVINGKIYTMEDDRIIDNGYLFIENGIIKKIGNMGDKLPYDKEITDAAGRYIFPGFIDAHSHIGMWEDGLCFEGDDGNESTDPSTPHLRAIDAVNTYDRCFAEAYESGVTTVITGPGSANPIGGQLIAMKTFGSYIDKMIIKNPVAIKMALGENPKAVYNGKSEAPMTRMATAGIIREQLYKAQRYYDDICDAENNDDVDLPEFDFKCEALIPLLKGDIKAHIHAHRRDDIITAIRIAKEFNINYVIVHGTEGYLIPEVLKENNCQVLSGPLLCDRSKPELKNLNPASAGVLSGNGIKTAIITDHPVIPVQYLATCAALAVREGMDKYSAIKAITVNAAEICDIADRVGSIKEGKDADFSVFSEFPLSVQAKPDMVFVDGKKVK